MPRERALTISELARRAGVSPKTIRHWEREGLVRPSARSRANYRLFVPADVERVHFILKAKSLGFSLKEIRRVFDLARSRTAPCEAVMSWTERKVAELKERVRMLDDLRMRLERYKKRWAREPQAGGVEGLVCQCIASVPVEEARRVLTHSGELARGRGAGK